MSNNDWYKGKVDVEYIESIIKTEDNGKMRRFASGASRDTGTDKLQYDKFLSPIVLKAFAEFMHTKREMPDGPRQGDNWQKGIPLEVYMESMSRHYMDTWLINRGYHGAVEDDLVTTLVSLMFNVHGMLHEVLKKKSEVSSEPCAYYRQDGEEVCDDSECEDCREYRCSQDTESWYEGEVDEEYIKKVAQVWKKAGEL